MSKIQKQKLEKILKLPDDTLLDAQQLLDLSKYGKEYKNVQSQYRINEKDYTLVDISLENSGEAEDYILAESKLIHQNIRRGLTVLITYQNNEEQNKTICRRGMKKFFDIYLEFINDDLLDSWVSKNRIQNNIKNITIRNILNKLNENQQILMIRTEKANGENCQISFNSTILQWIVSSKNSSRILQFNNNDNNNNKKNNNNDLIFLIGQCWTEIISKIQEEQLNELKQYLSDKTIVGEFIGHPNHQHIVPYDKPQIKFYAIVEHSSNLSCIAPTISFDVFKKFSLPIVDYNQNHIETKEQFYYIMNEIYKDVSLSSVQEGGEGQVVYFQCNNECISVGKLKTMEYRIFRKLREKLRISISKQSDPQKMFKKFVDDVQELCQYCKPKNKPLQYYFDIASDAFKLISQNQDYNKMINQQYLQFLDEIINKLPLIQNLQIEEQKDQIVIQKQIRKENNLILIPITIPACGKTYLVENLFKKYHDNTIQFQSISSDDIRKKLMSDYIERNKCTDISVAFERTQKIYKTVYEDQLNQLFEKVRESNRNSLIFIDKNHPLNALDGIFRIIKSKMKSTKKIAIIPHCLNPFKDFPFSLCYLCHCINNVIQRIEHQTLVGSIQHRVAVVVIFFKYYRGVQLKDLDQQFDYLFLYPFNIEDDEKESKLKTMISHILIQLWRHKDLNQMEQTEEILDLIKVVKSFEWQMPKQEDQEQIIDNFIQSLSK